MLGLAEMAAVAINACKAKHVAIVRGTPYHTGVSEEFENEVYEKVKLPASKKTIRNHLYLNVSGVQFDCKHKVGSSQIPHGRATSIKREMLWNDQWALTGVAPRCNILIRSHVHYHEYTGNRQGLQMTTPALQGLGSRYGEQQCSGVVDWGFVYFDVWKDGSWTWDSYMPDEANDLQQVEIVQW